jgi:2-polyprenyl-3-methyl-5-hydroxy-6-metoxy-1,4-benzoquinol methylase
LTVSKTTDLVPDRIELLSENLIGKHPLGALEVLGYSSRLGIPLGWHYLWDLIWILKRLDAPPGSTIPEAGAGNGILQFLLAERGYRVINVDMIDRVVPDFASTF